MDKEYVSDVLIISADFSPVDEDMLVIGRKNFDKETIEVVNILMGEEAVEVYNKLVGNNVYYN